MQETTATRGPLTAPNAAGLVLGFVNTRATGNGDPERLGDAHALRAWAEEAVIDLGDWVLSDADAASARDLRQALVTILLAHVDVQEPGGALPEAEQRLRQAAALHPLQPVITADGCEFISAQQGVPGMFGTIFAAIADIAQRNMWSRMKMCRNLPCHVGFFDKTRNSSGLYCSPSCSSQVTMRAYRERQKAGQGTPNTSTVKH
ncbi:CGNR zinc finger domain-containing protein [Nonomuraea sp. NPDC003707]